MKNCKIEKIIASCLPLTDELGDKFMPFCSYFKHRGIIKKSYYKMCVKKKCVHYVKFEETENDEGY